MSDYVYDAELIDLCTLCGKWNKEDHLCYPNDGLYSEEEWPKILEVRKTVAVRNAAKFIKRKKAKMTEEFALELNQLLKKIRTFKTEIRGILRVPHHDFSSTPKREKERHDGLKKFKSRLDESRRKVSEMVSNNFDKQGMASIDEILVKINNEYSEIESMDVIHLPMIKSKECICTDFPTMQCPQHPGRNSQHPGRN